MGYIYAIKNILDNKMYIGQTINIESRISAHRNNLINNKHHSSKLQNAFNKYGKENFKLIILEENVKKELLNEREIY